MDNDMDTSHQTVLPQILEIISGIPDRRETIRNVLRNIEGRLSENDRETFGDRLEDVVKESLHTGQRLGLLNVARNQIKLPFNIRPNNIPDFTVDMVEDEASEPEQSVAARRVKTLKRSLASVSKSESSEEIKQPEKKRYRPKEKKPLRGRGGRDGRNGERNRHGGGEGHGGGRREPDAKRGRSGPRATGRPIVQPNPSSSSSFEENVKKNRKPDRLTPRKNSSAEWEVRNVEPPPQRRQPAPRAKRRTNRTCRKRRAPIRRAKRPIAARKLARRRQAARKAKARNCRRRR